MSRPNGLSSPFLLGFETIERAIDRVAKGSDGYPPYNVERIPQKGNDPELIRIALAVAGFTWEQLEVTVEDKELIIRGRQFEEDDRIYIHRGIAARHFQRVFVLADGMEVLGATLENGLLMIDLARPEPQRRVRAVDITVRGKSARKEVHDDQ
jgi:HSP20 family molecular chaperone IbpA